MLSQKRDSRRQRWAKKDPYLRNRKYRQKQGENVQTRSTQITTLSKYPRSNRIVPLNREAEMCLELMLNTYEPNKIRSDFIISAKTGNIPTKRNIQLSLDRILKRIGEKHYGTHAMRHTFAARLLSKTSSYDHLMNQFYSILNGVSKF